MNTFQLRCFIAVAENLNFARAAEQLNITQPAITHQIQSLEAELSAKLFRRTTRTVELTSSGFLFLPDARNILAISTRAANRFRNPDEQQMQPLTIGCHSFAQLFILPDILKQMADIYPQIHPNLQVVPFPHLHRLLESEEVDAIIGFQEADNKKITSLYKELAKIPVCCVCPNDHPLARRASVHVSDLESERLVLSDPGKSPHIVAQIQAQLLGGRPFSQFYFCDSSEAVTVLVKAGFGVAVLPESLIPPDGSLARIALAEIEPISFGVYYKTLQGNPMLKNFIQMMKETFSVNFQNL